MTFKEWWNKKDKEGFYINRPSALSEEKQVKEIAQKAWIIGSIHGMKKVLGSMKPLGEINDF